MTTDTIKIGNPLKDNLDGFVKVLESLIADHKSNEEPTKQARARAVLMAIRMAVDESHLNTVAEVAEQIHSAHCKKSP